MDYRHQAKEVHKIVVMLDNRGPSKHGFTRKNSHVERQAPTDSAKDTLSKLKKTM